MLTMRMLVCGLVLACSASAGHAGQITNKSFEGRYKTTARTCAAGRCDDQSETLTSAFFIGQQNARVYAGANKGLILPFGQRTVSAEGRSVWLTPTPSGFDETYAKDGFTIQHRYAVRPDGTCSISVSVIASPAATETTYRTDVDSCTVTDGDVFAAR